MTKRVLLSLAFLEGGLVMLLELVIPHVLAPVLGNSVEMWAKLILLSVGGLALGYFLGGYLAKNFSSLKLGILIFLSFVFGLISYFIIAYFNTNQLFSNEVTTAYFIAFLGLFLPTIALASTTPLIISEYSENSNSAGLIFSYSTWGGILFTILTGFYFIPEFGLVKTLQIFLVFASVMIVLITWKSKIKTIK